MIDELYLREMLTLKERAEDEKEMAAIYLDRAKQAIQSSNVCFARYVELSGRAAAIQKAHG